MPSKPRLQPLARAVLHTQTDERLVALARRGKEIAFDEIVRRYRTGLVAFAAAYGPPDPEDVVQESLVRAWDALRDSTGEMHLKAWLYTIVRNRALNARRDARVHEELTEEVDGVPQPVDIVLTNEELDRVVGAVAALPDQQREALVRSALEGHTHEQIAGALGSTPGAVRQLIYRARVAVRHGVGFFIPLPLVAVLAELGAGAAGAAGGTAAGGAAAAGGAGGASIAAKVAAVAAVGAVAVGSGVAIDRSRGGGGTERVELSDSQEPRGGGSSAAQASSAGTSASQGSGSGVPGGGSSGSDDPGGNDRSGDDHSSGSGGDDDSGDEDFEAADDSGHGSDDSGPGSDDSGDGSDDSGNTESGSGSSGHGSGSSGTGTGGGGSSGPGSGEDQEPVEIEEPDDDNSGSGGGESEVEVEDLDDSSGPGGGDSGSSD
jgi:RNA polymerase sigma factor (sigma-70 family)